MSKDATMKEADKKRIVEKLQEKQVNLPCPRCSNNRFSVADGYFAQTIQDDVTNFRLGGPTIPTAVTVCDRCGYVSLHALGALGLLPNSKREPANG